MIGSTQPKGGGEGVEGTRGGGLTFFLTRWEMSDAATEDEEPSAGFTSICKSGVCLETESWDV